MSALAHDERCETKNKHGIRPVNCLCAERALAATRQQEEYWHAHFDAMVTLEQQARQREEEAKANADFLRESIGECHVMISRNLAEFQLKQDWDATTLPHRLQRIMRERDALRAENDRLTLAASESARTLQVEIAALKHGHALCDKDYNHAINTVTGERDALKDQMTALRGILERLTKESAANPKGNFYDGVRYALAALYQDGDTQ